MGNISSLEGHASTIYPHKSNRIRDGQPFACKNMNEGLDALNTIGGVSDFSLDNLRKQ